MMTSLSTILGAPIRWREAATSDHLRLFLGDLQANILKGHGRSHAGHIFVSFGGMQSGAVAALLRDIGQHCTSAYQHLRGNKRYPPFLDGGTVRCVFLSAGGYHALGPKAKLPAGAAFAGGMASRQATLQDPPRAAWGAVGWRSGHPSPDAMILVADADADAVTRELEAVEGWLNGTGARILVVERGLQQHRSFKPGAKAEGVEHFGYVDGRSQPLFLAEDLDHEDRQHWQAEFKPSQFIVPDPNGRGPLAAGSYFVFRKLEQNVCGFKKAERELGIALFGAGSDPDLRERAGAMVVGRFEDGTPLVQHADAQAAPPPNDFNFSGDADGLKCPFHAHIRKVNPRGDVKATFHLPDDSGDRNPIMARRGITYGQRRMLPDGSDFADAEGQEPTKDVGLLFMAYMASIENQFEFTQHSWANNADFVRPGTGIDPTIGQNPVAGSHDHSYVNGWDAAKQTAKRPFAGFVGLQGGEYFFAPSLSFLRSVGL